MNDSKALRAVANIFRQTHINILISDVQYSRFYTEFISILCPLHLTETTNITRQKLEANERRIEDSGKKLEI